MVLKCLFCKIRKISSLFSYSCKCGLKNLCDCCKMPEDHQCKFDYIREAQIKLTKDMPVVIGTKLNKI